MGRFSWWHKNVELPNDMIGVNYNLLQKTDFYDQTNVIYEIINLILVNKMCWNVKGCYAWIESWLMCWYCVYREEMNDWWICASHLCTLWQLVPLLFVLRTQCVISANQNLTFFYLEIEAFFGEAKNLIILPSYVI